MSYPLSTAEAVLRHLHRALVRNGNGIGISIVYCWGGIETVFHNYKIILVFLLSTAETVLRQIDTQPASNKDHFYCLPLRRYWDQNRIHNPYFSACGISIVYRWGGIETLVIAHIMNRCRNFYCLPLRRYWDGMMTTLNPRAYADFYCLPLRRYWDPSIFFIC